MAFSAKFALALVVLCFIQVAMTAHVRRSSAVNASGQLGLTEEFGNLFSFSNLEDIITKLEAVAEELEESFKNLTEDMNRQYEENAAELSEKANATFGNATQRLNASLENMKAKVPGAMEEVSSVQQRFLDTFHNTSETLFAGTEKMAKSAGEGAEFLNNIFTDLSRTAIEKTIQVMQKMQQEVQEAVKKAIES